MLLWLVMSSKSDFIGNLYIGNKFHFLCLPFWHVYFALTIHLSYIATSWEYTTNLWNQRWSNPNYHMEHIDLLFRDILHKTISIYQNYIIIISSNYMPRIVLNLPDLRLISWKIERWTLGKLNYCTYLETRCKCTVT